MRASVLAVLVLSVLFFVPGLRESFEPPKVAAVRVVGLALLALAVTRAPIRRFRHVLDLAAVAWLVAEVASTIASQSPALSLVGEPVQREGLITSLALAGIYAGTRGAWREREFARMAVDALLVAAVLSSLVALLQVFGLDPFGWAPSYQTGPNQTARPFGTLGHPNLLGAVAAALAPLAFAMAVQEPRGRTLRLVAGLALSLVCIATLSRGAMLGCAAGIAIAAIMLAWNRRTAAAASTPVGLGRSAVWISAGILAVLIIAFAAGDGSRAVIARLREMSPTAGTGATRVEIWRSALAAWRAAPWLGTGPDTFALVFPHHQTLNYWKLEWGGLPVHAHSVVLQLLATRGAIGLAAALAWVAALKLSWWRAWRSAPSLRPMLAGFAGALGALVVTGAFGAIGITGALVMAVVTSVVADLSDAPPAVAQPTRGAPYTVPLAATVGAIALVFGIADIVSSHAGNDADTLLASARAQEQPVEADRADARDRAALAARLAPLDDVAHRVYAEALLGAAATARVPRPTLEAATVAADRALALAPTRAENHEQRARLLAARALAGDPSAAPLALQEIDRLASLAPRNALLLDEAARLELALGRPADAQARARGIVEQYPDDGPAWLTLAMSAAAAGDTAATRAALDRAAAASWHGNDSARGAAEAWREQLSVGANGRANPGQPAARIPE